MDPGWEINNFFTHIRAGSISFIGIKRKWKSFNCVRLFVIPWTLVHGILQARIWSGGDLPNPGIELRSPSLQTDSLPAEPQGKPKNTGVGSLSFLQEIFPTEELNQDLLHCRQTLQQRSYEGSPMSFMVTFYSLNPKGMMVYGLDGCSYMHDSWRNSSLEEHKYFIISIKQTFSLLWRYIYF